MARDLNKRSYKFQVTVYLFGLFGLITRS